MIPWWCALVTAYLGVAVGVTWLMSVRDGIDDGRLKENVLCGLFWPVERMREQRWWLHLTHGTSDTADWIVQIGQPSDHPSEENHWGRFYIERADTAPLAIARAALKAVEG